MIKIIGFVKSEWKFLAFLLILVIIIILAIAWGSGDYTPRDYREAI